MLSNMNGNGFSQQTAPRVSTDLVIETPENALLTYRLAGPAVRLQAYLVDLLIRVAVLFVCACLFSMAGAFVSAGVSAGLYLVLWFVFDWFYFGLSEGLFRGKTMGKHLYGLRVIKEEGYPITLWAALLRNFVRAADSLPMLYGVGFLTMLIAGQFRRLGDIVARTVVIEERRVRVPREPIILEKIEPLPRTDLGGYVPAGQTLALIEEYLGRRYVLTYQRGHALAQVLAQALARKLNVTGDPQLVEKFPMAFLARVYATFHRTREVEEMEELREEPVRRARREPAGAIL